MPGPDAVLLSKVLKKAENVGVGLHTGRATVPTAFGAWRGGE